MADARQPAPSGLRILLVEDDPDMAVLVSESLAEAGYAGQRVPLAEEGLWPQPEAPFDAVVLDHAIPRGGDAGPGIRARRATCVKA
jgi:DNA-binding response OmpR family regulator